jgi:hypothetical protein
MKNPFLASLFVAFALVGCGDDTNVSPRDASAPTLDASVDVTPDAGALGRCADTFGTALPAGYGRLDGIIHAVVRPNDQTCAMPNSTHLVLQVRMNAAVYRMVVNVQSTRAGTDPAVRFAEVTRAFPPPAWSEGFHVGVTLDYANDLVLHAGGVPFERVESAALVERIVPRLTPGMRVAVYSQGSGGASTHLVHRNGQNDDGSIVLDPMGASPRWMVFHFADQTF